jgi:hypothetical protein
MSYELINTLTTNTLASFERERDAQHALQHFLDDNPDFASHLAIVSVDDEGEAQDEAVVGRAPFVWTGAALRISKAFSHRERSTVHSVRRHA